MLYIVRDKNTKRILHHKKVNPSQDVTPEQIYEHFDLKSMEIGKLESEDIPQHFTIDEKMTVIPLSKPEEVDYRSLGLIKSSRPMHVAKPYVTSGMRREKQELVFTIRQEQEKPIKMLKREIQQLKAELNKVKAELEKLRNKVK